MTDERLFRQIVEALRQTEARYHHLAEQASDIIYTHTLDGRMITINPAGERVLGYSRAELMGKSILDLIAPEHRALARRTTEEKVLAGAGATTYVVDVLTKAGDRLTLEFTTQVIFDEDAPMAVQGIARDVSARPAAEQALRASEERFRKILETTGEGIVMRDTDGYITFANERFGQMLGYTVTELVGKHVREIISPEHIPLQRASEERRKRTRAAETLDMRFVRKDGTVMDAILSVSPTFDEHDNYTGALAMISDMTERRRLERQLQQSQKMEAVGRLAGGVAHDFNNLLTAIRGHADLVLNELPADSPFRSDMQEIRAAADRAATLTQQLLAFSRRQMLQPVVLDVDTLIREMQPLIARLLPGNVALSTRLAGAGTRVRADPSQIEHVLVQLVVNAREAMPAGGELRVTTQAFVMDEGFTRANPGASPGAYARIALRDTGIGMDAQTLSHIFEPFYTTKDVGQGSGLGLATVYGIVKQSGGFVRANSTVGVGTEFEIFLPRVQDAIPDARQAAEPGYGAEGETILVAEDEPAVRALTCRILRKRGYHVLEAGDGDHAVEVAGAFDGTIDLLVTDVIMPNLGGRELSERLVRMRPRVKVLFMSGYTDDQLLQRGVSGGGHFLEKPFTPDALARKVREVLDSE